jgi:O-antigen ligase
MLINARRVQSAAVRSRFAYRFGQSMVLWATITLILWACYAEGAFLSPAKTVVAVATPLLGLVWFVTFRRQDSAGMRAVCPGWGLTEWLLLSLCVLGALSSLWSLDWAGSLQATGILLGGLLVLRMGREIGWSSHRARSSILLITSAAGVALSLVSIVGYAFGLSRFTQTVDSLTLPTGTFGYANALASLLFLSLASTVALFVEPSNGELLPVGPPPAPSQRRARRWRPALLAAATVAQVTTLVLCRSRAAGAITIVLLLLMLCARAVRVAKYSSRHRRIALVALVLVVICAIGAALLWQRSQSQIPSADAFRVRTWTAALEAAEGRPFLGHGLDTFYPAYSAFKSGAQTSYAHNIVIQYLVELGSLGATLLVAFLIVALALPTRTLLRPSAGPQIPLLLGLQGFALHNLVDLTWFFPALFLVFMLLLGLMLSYSITRPSCATGGNNADRQRSCLWYGMTGLAVVLLAAGGGLALWLRG